MSTIHVKNQLPENLRPVINAATFIKYLKTYFSIWFLIKWFWL